MEAESLEKRSDDISTVDIKIVFAISDQCREEYKDFLEKTDKVFDEISGRKVTLNKQTIIPKYTRFEANSIEKIKEIIKENQNYVLIFLDLMLCVDETGRIDSEKLLEVMGLANNDLRGLRVIPVSNESKKFNVGESGVDQKKEKPSQGRKRIREIK